MGLDMYLEKYPRGYRPEEVSAFEQYIDYRKRNIDEKYTMKEWCGIEEEDVPKGERAEELLEHLGIKYYVWDTEKKYPYEGIHEQVGYWRKANEIHKWFVDHVQDGFDDCKYHHEVTEGKLRELLAVCRKVTEYFHTNSNGEIVVDCIGCENELPTETGFFFGSTEYDEWYVQDVEYTEELCEKLLKETDFEAEALFYVSSW